MKLEAGLLSFESVRTHNAEIVRQWRNAEHVRRWMIDQSYISPEQQQKWVQSIQNDRYIYLLASFRDEPFGVVNLKDIDWGNMCAETGIFIGDPQYLHHPVASATAIVTLHFVFGVLHFNKIYSRSLLSNHFLRSHTEKLGFRLIDVIGDVQHWLLTPAEFTRACQKYLASIFQFLCFSGKYVLTLDEHDVHIGFYRIIEHILSTNLHHCEVKEHIDKQIRYVISDLQ